jgi:hypothetical protein
MKHRFVLALLIFVSVSQFAIARGCTFNEGEDRWGIKTSVPNGVFNQEVLGPPSSESARLLMIAFLGLRNLCRSGLEGKVAARITCQRTSEVSEILNSCVSVTAVMRRIIIDADGNNLIG